MLLALDSVVNYTCRWSHSVKEDLLNMLEA